MGGGGEGVVWEVVWGLGTDTPTDKLIVWEGEVWREGRRGVAVWWCEGGREEGVVWEEEGGGEG